MTAPTDPSSPVRFRCGVTAPNRFMLAPLTNKQSADDGTLSDEELRWLRLRAKGGFGIVMTCATSVQATGRCWEGQLGIHTDELAEHHRPLTEAIHTHGSLALVQLHHGGMRAPAERNGGRRPVSASDVERHDARAMTTAEVEQTRDAFVAAAVRAQRVGYDGVEVHGAHGYLLTQFLSARSNQRTDRYGGDTEGRATLLLEIVEGIRDECGPSFLLAVRLSLERFGIVLEEGLALAQRLLDERRVDLLDLSLWDVDKQLEDGRTLLEVVAGLDPGDSRLTVAGHVRDGATVHRVLDAGIDVATIGRAAILHHDFPERVIADPGFEPVETPVTPEHLAGEGLSPVFAEYMRSWEGFVTDDG